MRMSVTRGILLSVQRYLYICYLLLFILLVAFPYVFNVHDIVNTVFHHIKKKPVGKVDSGSHNPRLVGQIYEYRNTQSAEES